MAAVQPMTQNQTNRLRRCSGVSANFDSEYW